MTRKKNQTRQTKQALAVLMVVLNCLFSNAAFAQNEFWGMTSSGGQDGLGTIFKTDATGNNQTVQHSFIKNVGGTAPQYTHLIQATDGYLYGMTDGGGTNGIGVLFQYNPATNTYINKLDFDGNNGSNPKGSLIQASDGNLYGMTSSGGSNNKGVLFQYNPTTNTFTKKHDFDGANGGNPFGSLMQAADGNMELQE